MYHPSVRFSISLGEATKPGTLMEDLGNNRSLIISKTPTKATAGVHRGGKLPALYQAKGS